MIATVDPFHAIAVSRLAHDMEAAGQSVIHMEFGQPSTGAPTRSIALAHTVLDNEAMGYWESVPLKSRIARHYADSYGVDVDPEQVILTCGASPAFVMALSCLFRPGARVALARPGYVAYRNTLKAMYLEPVEMDCGADARFQVTAAALNALDPVPDGLIIASPANPTGTIIAADELAAIAEVCQRKGIRVVSDEIYHCLSYGQRAASMLEYWPQAVIVNSFSKYFSMAGWRLGWLVVPPALIEPARARMGSMFLTPPVLAQKAGLMAFECRDELEGHLETYARNRAILLDALPKLGLGHIAPPDGAFYIYADASEFTQDSLAFCTELLRDTGVCIAPGIDFDPVNGHRFVRFSFAVSTPLIEEAVRRMAPWFAEQRGPGAAGSV